MAPRKDRPQKRDKHGNPLCGAKKKNGKTCSNAAGKGTDHVGYGPCLYHGGQLPSVKKAVHKQIAAEAVVTYGLPREVDPQTALLEEVWRTAGHVDYLFKMVQLHDPEALVWGVIETKEIPVDTKDGKTTMIPIERKSAARPSIWLDLYRKERSHLVEVCRVAIAAGIEERRVRLAEEEGKMIAQVIRGVLEDLGVSDRPELPKIVRNRLLLVANNPVG